MTKKEVIAVESPADISAVILTYNESKNIVDCINSIKPFVKDIFVIDSFSDDETVKIAKQMGAVVLQNKWINYAKQFQFALDTCPIKTKWVLRFDADERMTIESGNEITSLCSINTDTDVNGINIRLAVRFLGKTLKHGGIYPIRVLRIFKYGIGYIEQKNMDEHICLSSGKILSCKKDCIHENFNDITTWIDKHNKYSNRELADYLENNDSSEGVYDKSTIKKRKRKNKFYYKLPIGFRAHLYFIYRYYFKFGFLDGKPGKFYAFLQAYWYRYLVDIKIYEHNLKNKK